MYEDLGGGRLWDFLEESMWGSVLKATRSQGRSRSDRTTGLERRAGPALCGAWTQVLSLGRWKPGGFN